MQNWRFDQEQIITHNNTWKFELGTDLQGEDNNEFVYKADLKKLDSPVLWIWVDPDMEYIRQIKIHQTENNWHFQLMKEWDIIGQIEAINEMKWSHITKDSYTAIQNVINNKEYFFYVRKEAVKALAQINTAEFNEYLSSERFLLKIFKTGYSGYTGNALFFPYLIKYVSECWEEKK